MPKDIFFPKITPSWIYERDCVRFYAAADGKPLQCLVSIEALMVNFGVHGPDPKQAIQAYLDNQQQIQELARLKIENGEYERGDEVVLRTDDFPEPTTTTRPPSGFTSSIASEFQNHPEMLDAIKKANKVLEYGLHSFGTPVQAEWMLLHSDPHQPLIILELTDGRTGATVDGLFSVEQMNKETLRFDLFRLWDDMLREGGRLLMESSTASA